MTRDELAYLIYYNARPRSQGETVHVTDPEAFDAALQSFCDVLHKARNPHLLGLIPVARGLLLDRNPHAGSAQQNAAVLILTRRPVVMDKLDRCTSRQR